MQDKFKWWTGIGTDPMRYFTGVNKRDFFLEKEACRLAYDKGRKAVIEMFGDRLRVSPPSPAGLSYGHMASIGANIVFPDDSEPAVEPMFSSLEEAIRWLRRDFNFGDADLFKKYYETYTYLKESFPDEKVVFRGYGFQGPVTTAVLLRSTDFYMDIYDYPDLAKEYLDLVTRSIIKFAHFLSHVNGWPEVNPDSSYIGDDLSSLISPGMWSELVVPYTKKYYEETTTGSRSMHVENLTPLHLKHLEQIGVDFYDPSVSPMLNPRIIRENIGIDFSWRLLSIDIPDMTVEDVKNWVIDSVNQGARNLYTRIATSFCLPHNQKKAVKFMDTCQQIENGEIKLEETKIY